MSVMGKWRVAWLIGTILLATTAAQAEMRPYVSIAGGVDIPSDLSVEVADVSVGQIQTGSGFAFGLSGGADFGTLRTELRVDIRRASIEQTTGPAASIPLIPTSGRIGVLGIVPEVSFDYPILSERFEIHAGVGLGAAQLRDTTFSDWGLAYTAHLGLYWPVLQAFGVDVTYRFTGVASGFDTPNPGARIVWRDNAVTAGFRFYFADWRR